jgi:hypothetical protein
MLTAKVRRQYASISYAKTIRLPVDLLKLEIQRHEHSPLKGAEQLIGAGHIGTIFMELNWVRRAETTCAATQSVQLFGQADYLFSKQPAERGQLAAQSE